MVLSSGGRTERRRFNEQRVFSDWIQTMPGEGWFTILRLYSPLEPFFTKEWRPSEIELVK